MLDSAAALAANHPADLCGDETFFEHVHFNFDGNYRLGLGLGAKNRPQASPRVRRAEHAASALLANQNADSRLALTDWNRSVTVSEVIRRRQQPPLNGQSDNTPELESLRNEVDPVARSDDRCRRRAAASALYPRRISGVIRTTSNCASITVIFWKPPEIRLWSAAALWREVEALLPHVLSRLFAGRPDAGKRGGNWIRRNHPFRQIC